MKSLRSRSASTLAFGALLVSSVPCLAQGGPAQGSLPLDINWLEVQGRSQPTGKDRPGVLVTCRIQGQEKKIFLPIIQDTSLWKGNEKSSAGAKALTLRDNRYSQGLIKLDVSPLPADAEIVDASFTFRLTGVEKKGLAGELRCYQILTPWAEDAGWSKPDPKGNKVWDGLKPERDFTKDPFTKLSVEVMDDRQKNGQFITIPDFAKAVKAWRDGTWENNGFLMALHGPALQIGVPARESAGAPKNYVLGGKEGGHLLLVPNVPMLQRVLRSPQDLVQAQPVVFLEPSSQKGTGTLSIYSAPLTADLKSIEGNGKWEKIGSVPLASLTSAGIQELPGIREEVLRWLGNGAKPRGIVLGIEGDVAAEVRVSGKAEERSVLRLSIPAYEPVTLVSNPFTLKKNVYAETKDGHLSYDGKRLRLWGVVGFPDPARLNRMGFNAQRVWEPTKQSYGTKGPNYTLENAKRGEFPTYVKGDDSGLDKADKHMANLKKHGIFVMFAGLTGTIPVEALVEDGSFVSGGEGWAEWQTAMRELLKTKKEADAQWYVHVDKRLQEAKKKYAKNILTHVNPYTGKAYGEEEHIVTYEVFNENGFVFKILGGQLRTWPPFFANALNQQWNAWLKQKYKDDAALTAAWGSVKEGESLARASIASAPDLAQRAEFPAKRAEDFIQFLTGLVDNLNQDFRSYCRSLFPAGVGVNKVPFSFDTFYRPNPQWSFNQSLGDVNSIGMYFWDLESTLSKPPAAFVIDTFTVENKPTILYETNAGRPGPMRAEFPLKLAAMAAHQDWDGVFWHYWGPKGKAESADLGYLKGTLAPPHASHFWNAVHHELDPVMCSSMMMAGQIFLHGKLPPAPKPDIVEMGRDALFSYANFQGVGISQFTFQNGSRLRFSPDKAGGLTLNGGPLPSQARLEKAIAAGEYIKWDWPNARLIIDSPSVKAYVGKIDGPFQFSDGITLGDVSTPWISFAMVSNDGSPLVNSTPGNRIFMTGVYDAVNTGFQFDYKVKGGPVEQAKAVLNVGAEPVQVTPVEFTVWMPREVTGAFQSYDFALREIAETPLANVSQVTQKGGTPFVNTLTVTSMGGVAKTPLAAPTEISIQEPADRLASAGSANAAATSSWLILPELPWDMDYTTAHKYMRDSTYVLTNIDKEDLSKTPKKRLSISGIQLPSLGNNLADINLEFTNDKVAGSEVTFIQPPAIDTILQEFTKLLGEPVEKKLDTQYGNTRLRWMTKNKPSDVLITESQGVMKILIAP